MSEDVQKAIATIMKNAQSMMSNGNGKQQYEAMLAKQKETIVTAQAGGERVKASVNLQLTVTAIDISAEGWAESPEVLSGLIISAVNEAINLAKKEGKAQMSGMAKMMGLPSAADQ